jgi:hypothetical protein
MSVCRPIPVIACIVDALSNRCEELAGSLQNLTGAVIEPLPLPSVAASDVEEKPVSAHVWHHATN